MIPQGFSRKGRRCATVLSATVLCAAVCIANCDTIVLEQTPAQDRQGGGGGFFDHLYRLNPFGSAPAAPAHNMPDVSGFGMYPLWKFHKFDGLSLRPVPYGVDIGSGLPPPPHPPSYPAGFLNAPIPPTRQISNYGPPASPPPTNYEAAPPSSAPNYSPPAYNPPAYNPPAYNPPAYNPPAAEYSPPLQPQIMNYELQSNSYPAQAPPANNYGNSYNAPAAPPQSYNPNVGGQLTMSYQPVTPQRYKEPAGAYSAPAPATTYAEPSYNAVPPQTSYGTPMGPADNMQYGASNGITIQFSAAPQQEYGMQPSQGSYNPSASGSFQMPTYSESPVTFSQMDSQQAPMDTSYGSGSFMKRSETAKTAEVVEGTAVSDNSFSA